MTDGRRWWRSAVFLAVVVAGCTGSPRDLGTVRPRDPGPGQDHDWTLVEVEGIVPAAAEVTAELVDVDPDGKALTAFFPGGNTSCYAVSGVQVQHDPPVPVVTIEYGLRFGVMGCTAEGTFLAIRVPLQPPFEPR